MEVGGEAAGGPNSSNQTCRLPEPRHRDGGSNQHRVGQEIAVLPYMVEMRFAGMSARYFGPEDQRQEGDQQVPGFSRQDAGTS